MLFLFVGIAVLLIALAIPLLRRRVPPNHWYGLRVPPTFADERVWYDANAATARDFIKLAMVELVAALALPWFLSEMAYVLINLAVLVVGVVWVAVVGWRRAEGMLMERGRR